MSNLILDNVIMMQSMLERLKSNNKYDAIEICKSIIIKIAVILSDFNGNINNRSKAEKIINRLKKELKPELDSQSIQLLDEIKSIALLLALTESASFSQVFNKIQINNVDEESLYKSLDNRPLSLKNWNQELYLSGFINGWSVLALKQITNSVTQTFAQGESVEFLQGLIYSDRDKYSVISKIAKDYDSIACTAMQHAQSVAVMEFYSVNPELVKEEEFAAILDSKTSVICRSLDGQKFPVGVGPRPPLHFGCRSRMLPVLNKKILPPDSEINNVNSVYGDETYYQWLARQSVKRQDIVLGTTRGKLFRNGGLTAEQFAKLQLHKNFKPMTLDEMKKAVPDAFERASI